MGTSRFYATSAMIVAAAVLGATAFVAWRASGPADAFAECRSAAVAGGSGAIGGPFTLVDGQGRTVTDRDVITEPTLLYFGYTFCPDVCPLDTARNAAAVDILEEMGISATPAFISIDPERDTPEVVGEFAALVHPKMIGLTGSADQVRAASQAYRTYFRKQDEGGEFYLVDHSTFTYLVLPGVGFVEFFRRDDTPDDVAQRTACFVTAAGSGTGGV